nr:amidohydrolase family protein [Nocardia crassostreae]
MTALAAYTAGSAHINHLDDTGSLRPGNLADLIVLDQDPFQIAPTDIATLTVTQTYVGGTRVFG